MRQFPESSSDCLYDLKIDLDRIADSLERFETNDVEIYTFIDNMKKSVATMQKETVAKLIVSLEKEY